MVDAIFIRRQCRIDSIALLLKSAEFSVSEKKMVHFSTLRRRLTRLFLRFGVKWRWSKNERPEGFSSLTIDFSWKKAFDYQANIESSQSSFRANSSENTTSPKYHLKIPPYFADIEDALTRMLQLSLSQDSHKVK